LLSERSLAYMATTRDGRANTTQFTFDPDSDEAQPFKALPSAKFILITFPIVVTGASARLVRLYIETHPEVSTCSFIQLGSTGIWDADVNTTSRISTWIDRRTPYDQANKRAVAEEELLRLNGWVGITTTVLNLCGLWGGSRSMRNYVTKIAPDKATLKKKGDIDISGLSSWVFRSWLQSSIHLIHGLDVARAILAVHDNMTSAAGQRWLITDGRVYDWWDLASAWGSGGESRKDDAPSGPHPTWVRELMQEEGIHALPRSSESLGRVLDSQDFWYTFKLSPFKPRLE